MEPPGWKRQRTTSGVSGARATKSPRSEATRIEGGSVGTNVAGNVGGEIDAVGVALPTRPSDSSPSGAAVAVAGAALGTSRSLTRSVPTLTSEACSVTLPSGDVVASDGTDAAAGERAALGGRVADRLGDVERRQSSNPLAFVRSITFPDTE